nr:hypothetical protein [Tanacetum cinerariifolium]
SSDVEDSPVNDRFVKVDGMHAIPPPMTGNYMPPKSDFGINSDDEHVTIPSKEQEKPSFAFFNTVEHVKTSSYSHLIRDCDFHKKRMAKQVELNKQKVLTKTGRFLVNVARYNFPSQVALACTTRKVNSSRPKVNANRPRHNVYKSHSPITKSFNRTSAPKANFAQPKVNTVGDKSVSSIGGKWETAIKASAGCNWRYKRHY